MNGFHGQRVLHVAAIELAVADLARSQAFYRDALGFHVEDRGSGRADVSADGKTVLVTLFERPGSRPRGRTAGLYHVAFLLPSRAALGGFLRRAIRTQLPIQGASDHHVSEAIYLADPDGNGLEFYADRDPSVWRDASGSLDMETDPFDYAGVYYAADDAFDRLPAETRIGHVHLAVNDLHAALAFYRDVLGFPVSSDDFPSAFFFAAGGYHHHLAINAWEQAGPRRVDRAGIVALTFALPDCESAAQVIERAAAAGHTGDDLADPDGTLIRILIA